MKRFMLILMLLLISLYVVENNENVGFSRYKPFLDITQSDNSYVLTWSKIPYLAYYEVEVLNRAPGSDSSSPSQTPAYRIIKYHTFETSLRIDQVFPENAYIRVSAHSLFHKPLGLYSNSVSLSELMLNVKGGLLKPISTAAYTPQAPAPSIPLLTWTTLPGAVYYEFELLSAPPENPGGVEPSRYQLMASREVYNNGFSVNLKNYNGTVFYWRVRALDYDGNPMGVFSDAAQLVVDHRKPQQLKPVSNAGYSLVNMPMPLYPVYSWFPIAGAVNYEVEVTSAPPENPNDIHPSRHRIRQQFVPAATDCYDEHALIIPGIYYWRVRGLDADGRPVGVFSDAEKFTVDLNHGSYAATFGDSITHGGGAISYSPADIEYSFQSYLSFPVMNLGKSGDTSETMMQRFESDVLPYHPKFLIIMGGSNSLRGGIPASQVIRELTSIRDKCLAHGIRPIFLTLPPINPAAIFKAFSEETTPNWQEQFSAVNSFIRKQRYFIDLEPYFLDETKTLPLQYATDGLHLDIEGKKLMGVIINSNWERVTR